MITIVVVVGSSRAVVVAVVDCFLYSILMISKKLKMNTTNTNKKWKYNKIQKKLYLWAIVMLS